MTDYGGSNRESNNPIPKVAVLVWTGDSTANCHEFLSTDAAIFSETQIRSDLLVQQRLENWIKFLSPSSMKWDSVFVMP